MSRERDLLIEKIKPLCPQTERLLAPIAIFKNDRIVIDVTKELDHFVFYTCSVAVRVKRDLPQGACAKQFMVHVPSGAPNKTYKRFKSFDLVDVERRPPSIEANVASWATRLPEQKLVDGGRIQTPCVDTSALIISSLWPSDQIVWASPEAKTVFDYLLKSFTSQIHRAEYQARFKETGDVMGYHEAWYASEVDDPDLRLTNYQRQAVACAYDAEGYALFKEQGTGKTYTSIRRVDLEVDNPNRPHPKRAFRVLVVCPKAVRQNWVNEINQFSTQSNRNIAVMRGGKLERQKALVEGLVSKKRLQYTIVSNESMVLSLAMLQSVEWDLIIVDESHNFKSDWSKRTKKLIELRDHSRMRMILTGTPITNHLGDLFWQLEFLGKGWSGFSSFKQFKRFYLQIHKAGRFDVITGVQNVPLLQERLARTSFLMRQSEALPDLPPLVRDVVEVEMSPEQAKLYEAIVEELRIEMENELETDDNRSITISNVLTRMLKLAQVTSGFLMYDQELDEYGIPTDTARVVDRFDPNPKVEAIVADLKEKLPHEKTRIWAHWVQDIKTLSARLTEEGIRHVVLYGDSKSMNPTISGNEDDVREEVKRQFNEDPSIRVIIANAAVGGTGVNLLGNAGTTMMEGEEFEIAGDHDMIMSQDWSMVKRSQLEKRGHRRGTKRQVRVTDYVVPGTIDEELRARVTNKRANAYALQDLRDIMSRLLTCLG